MLIAWVRGRGWEAIAKVERYTLMMMMMVMVMMICVAAPIYRSDRVDGCRIGLASEEVCQLLVCGGTCRR
jgi:hypothetical protein